MLSNITLGQYYPGNSVIHRLDPRIKILLSISFIVAVFLVQNLLGYVFALLYILLSVRMSTVPFKMLWRGIKPLKFILILTFVLNLFFSAGETVLVKFWIITSPGKG